MHSSFLDNSDSIIFPRVLCFILGYEGIINVLFPVEGKGIANRLTMLKN